MVKLDIKRNREQERNKKAEEGRRNGAKQVRQGATSLRWTERTTDELKEQKKRSKSHL